MLEQYVNELGKIFELSELDIGSYSSFKIKGMNVETKAYDAKGLGRVSLMEAKMPLGIMAMDTLIVNPFEKDAPLFSIDKMKILNRPILYVEMYDTLIGEDRKEEEFLEAGKQFEDIRNAKNRTKAWCRDIRYASSLAKKGRKKDAERLNSLMDACFEIYLKQLKEVKDCNREEKKKKADSYLGGLLENGGTATDNFVKNWGKEKTEAFFREVLFG